MSEIIDNRANRIRTLKQIIRHLHAGEAPEAVKDQMRRMVSETDYSEIVAMEQELMAEGMPVEEIQCMCDLHSQVTREVLVQLPPRGVPPGHPVDTFRRENEALSAAIGAARAAAAAIHALADDVRPGTELLAWRQAFNDLMDVEKHYQRKEHTLFSYLEKHGITGPSKVMWAKDDEARALLKNLGAALSQHDALAGEWKLVAETVGASALAALEEMIYKEEKILLPMCLETFTEDDWGEIWAASPQYGWCLVEPHEGYRPASAAIREAVAIESGAPIHLSTGNLSLEQLTAIFRTLPVDLTFVDEDDRVAFFSEGPDRVFSRSRAIIGRKVQHCHPPRSVDVVDRILADFREGRQNVAEFWINFHERFVNIRYFAVRDADGRYKGTLEVTQDLTHLRALEGERRLLEYDGAPAVLRSTTPEPAASVAGLPVPEPVERVRKAAGQDATGLPDWIREDRVRVHIDADAMLAGGEHPVGLVRESVAALKPGELVLMTVGFRPAPLIDMMRRSGAAVHAAETAPGHFAVYFMAAPE
jgi:uncharacterized protein